MSEVEKGKPALEIVKDGPPEGFRALTEVEQMRIELVATSLRLADEEVARWGAERDNAEARLSTASASRQGALMASKAIDQSLGLKDKSDIIRDKNGRILYVRVPEAPKADEAPKGDEKK
jgi:hypothetical protein